MAAPDSKAELFRRLFNCETKLLRSTVLLQLSKSTCTVNFKVRVIGQWSDVIYRLPTAKDVTILEAKSKDATA